MKQKMVKKNGLKNIGPAFFLIPLLILLIFFAIITLISIDVRVNNTKRALERHSLNIARSYAQRVADSRAAADIISELLDEKLIVAGEAVMLAGEGTSNRMLEELAERLLVDEINIYDGAGEVVKSNTARMMGWKAGAGHSLRDFIASGRESSTEEIGASIREGTFYKYAYFRGGDNTYIQIGTRADNINAFYNRFEIEELIRDIAAHEDVENVFFTDASYRLVAGCRNRYTNIILAEQGAHEHFLHDEPRAETIVVEGEKTLHVCAPVYHNSERMGTLTIFWPPDIIDDEIRSILLSNISRFVLISLTLVVILFYAYRKNKLNVEIAYYDKLTYKRYNKSDPKMRETPGKK